MGHDEAENLACKLIEYPNWGTQYTHEIKWAQRDLNARPLAVLGDMSPYRLCMKHGHIRPALHQTKLWAQVRFKNWSLFINLFVRLNILLAHNKKKNLKKKRMRRARNTHKRKTPLGR